MRRYPKPSRHPAPDGATVVGYGYVAPWLDGTPGWVMPTHLTTFDRDKKSARKYPGKVESRPWNSGEASYLCRITVKPVRDKRGRLIVRRIP